MEKIGAVILAGGLARRLNRVEKGLQLWQGLPLISHILSRLSPQIDTIYLNVNRHFDAYQARYPTLPQFQDNLPDCQGPLSGMLSALEHIDADYVLFVPCDSPLLPKNLLIKLQTSLKMNRAQIAFAHDGERAHPTFALIHRSVQPKLAAYLANGERRLLHFFEQQKSVAVDFSEQKSAFENFNCPEDFCKTLPIFDRLHPPKLLGITGYSGTGKTTLLEKLIPELCARHIRVGLIKHSHHNVEIDKPGKDSHRLRLAGANPTMVVCDERWALMSETPYANFTELVGEFADKDVDLILVEGFKHEPIPKIQLHRHAIEKPLPEQDQFTLATATDYPLARENLLNINDIQQIADFIEAFIKDVQNVRVF